MKSVTSIAAVAAVLGSVSLASGFYAPPQPAPSLVQFVQAKKDDMKKDAMKKDDMKKDDMMKKDTMKK